MAVYYTKWAFSGTSTPNHADYIVDGENVTYYNDVRWKYVVSESINSSANTSTYTVNKYAVFYYTWDSSSHSLSVTSKSRMPTSATYKSDTTTITSSTSSSGYRYVGRDSWTISHNADGTGSTSFTGYGTYTGGSGTVYTRTVTDTYIKMTSIDRKSSITSDATSATEFGDEINFTITRKSTDFTHDITYKMYDASGTIATGVDTSQNWVIPISLIASTPDNVNPAITITCTTKYGSKTIGTSTYTFNCFVPDSYIPTCSLALSDVGDVPSGWGIWLKGKSKIQGTITANGVESSTISNYSSSANNVLYTANPFTTDYLKYNGERTITSTVMDSRGRTASDTEDITVIDYFPATIVLCKVERCLNDGTLSDEGTYAKATIQYKIAPINDGTSDLNTKTVKIIYGSTEISETASSYEGTTVFSTLISDIELAASYNFRFQVIDSFDTVETTYTLPPAFVTQSLLAGGRGVTYGQVATEEGLISHFNTKFYLENWFKKASIDGLKCEKYATDNWIIYGEDD